MKYKPDDYVNSCFYGDTEDDVENKKSKVVKCRKLHQCMGGCGTEIKAGEHALLETGFMDGEPVSCYTCLPCIDKWLDEIMPKSGLPEGGQEVCVPCRFPDSRAGGGTL